MTTESLRPVLHAALSCAGWSSRYEPTFDRWVFQPPLERRSVRVCADGRVIVSDDVMRTTYPRTVSDLWIAARILGEPAR